MSEARNFK